MVITARKRSLGQGNVFTPVCHSVHRWSASRGGRSAEEVRQILPPHQILRDTVNKWAVRIPLKCILVGLLNFEWHSQNEDGNIGICIWSDVTATITDAKLTLSANEPLWPCHYDSD